MSVLQESFTCTPSSYSSLYILIDSYTFFDSIYHNYNYNNELFNAVPLIDGEFHVDRDYGLIQYYILNT